MFERPAQREHARECAEGTLQRDALSTLGLEMLRSCYVASASSQPLGAEQHHLCTEMQIYTIQAELRTGRQKRVFVRGKLFV